MAFCIYRDLGVGLGVLILTRLVAAASGGVAGPDARHHGSLTTTLQRASRLK